MTVLAQIYWRVGLNMDWRGTLFDEKYGTGSQHLVCWLKKWLGGAGLADFISWVGPLGTG